MKKKKALKRKSNRNCLHTACLACFSDSYEQYNPFISCQQCHVRFHRLCYTPKESSLCESCYSKKIKGNFQECQICPIQGLSSIRNDGLVFEKPIHIFCMFIHGKWKIKDGKLKYEKNNTLTMNPMERCYFCKLET